MAVRDQVQLLLWRAGFGATPAQVDAATAVGYSQAVENILTFTAPVPTRLTLPTIPPPLPLDATPEQMMARQQSVKQAVQIGLTALTDWWANQMSTSSADRK